jgi:Na+/H+-dicarboxylate symporter
MTGAPGGVIIALPPIFSAIGVPIQAVTIFVCIFSLIGMFTTIGNVIGNIGSTLILAKSENKLDTKIYRKAA